MTTALVTTISLPSTLNSAYLQAATSDNTRKAYQSDVRQFMAAGGLLPATTEMILTYLHTQAANCNPRTLKRRLTALRNWHRYQGFSDPTAHPLVTKTLTGISRIEGKPTRKAKALTLDELQHISHFLIERGKLSDYRDNALLQLGFFGAFRRSELVQIQWEHIHFVNEGMTILIPRSKTDQSGEGAQCGIPYGHENLCPIRALQNWQKKTGNKEGFVFRGITKGNQIAEQSLASGSVSTIIKTIVADSGLASYEQYSGHSLRRGFATEASKAGANMVSIMRQGRWQNEQIVAKYIEEGKQFQQNAADHLLKVYTK